VRREFEAKRTERRTENITLTTYQTEQNCIAYRAAGRHVVTNVHLVARFLVQNVLALVVVSVVVVVVVDFLVSVVGVAGPHGVIGVVRRLLSSNGGGGVVYGALRILPRLFFSLQHLL
jgi:hypothetical protein